MNDKLNLLANLVPKLAGNSDEETQTETLLRLQKISDKLNSRNQTVVQDDDADDYLTGQVAGHNEESTAVTHWCPGNRRFTKQEVRQGEQLKGAATCFEIDPISKLKD